MKKSHGHKGLHNIGEGKDGKWKYQVRINLSEEFAVAARTNLDHPSLKPLKEVLDKHGVTLKNQFDAFANFCRDAEKSGQTDSVLYRWTKDTIEKPGKEEAYATRFTVYKGDAQIYDKELADAVESDLQALKARGMITRINKIDSNPARNPQAPKRFER